MHEILFVFAENISVQENSTAAQFLFPMLMNKMSPPFLFENTAEF